EGAFMRVTAFLTIFAILIAVGTMTRFSEPVVAADPTPGAKQAGNCSAVFVPGKGVVDSCTKRHQEISRVYPRKPGAPANGCTDVSPSSEDAVTPAGTASSPVETPVASESTAAAAPAAEPQQNCDRVS